jgi:hypothetical protein
MRIFFCLAALLASAAMAAPPVDYLPGDHGLRYVGREGRLPVIVEITLVERPGQAIEYMRWEGPRSWATLFSDDTKTLRTRLEYRDGLLVPVSYDDGNGQGEQKPPRNLTRGTLDEFSVRLRARADVVRGVQNAEYTVWRGGDTVETWKLNVLNRETVKTPDGEYECFKLRLGNDAEWIEAWSAPLLLFHFVKIDRWRNGEKIAELRLDDKQLQ